MFNFELHKKKVCSILGYKNQDKKYLYAELVNKLVKDKKFEDIKHILTNY